MIVFLDTNLVIYAVENPPIWGAKVLARLASGQGTADTFMVSDLTRMECLVGPLKAGNMALGAEFRAFFSASGMEVVPITAGVCDLAASIRATKGFKPMDSLHLAAAAFHGANLFFTNDTRLAYFSGLKMEVMT